MSEGTLNFVAFGASLRKDSYNRKLLLECKRILEGKASVELLELGNFPLYSEELDSNIPEVVSEFKEKVRNSDGFIISSPEYDFTIPGYLKNALDFASRPPGSNPFAKKIGVIMSASMSMLGGARVQYHLRQVMGYLDSKVINKPEVFISFANQKFDQNGHLNDPMALQFLTTLLDNLMKDVLEDLELREFIKRKQESQN